MAVRTQGSVSVRVRVEGVYAPSWHTDVRLAVPGSTIFGLPASDVVFGEDEFDCDGAAQHIDLLEDRLAQAVSELR